jgi:hypothetical protein
VARDQKTAQEHRDSFLYPGETASPPSAEALIDTLAGRLRETGYNVWSTPFGYLCEWDLSVYGDSLAKVLERNSLASEPLD